jgi:hypothetical protein
VSRVARRIFGPKRANVMGDWRKLDSEELRSCAFRQMPLG